MNTPNKLTLLRVAMVPLFLIFLYLPMRFHILIAVVVFIAASITDYLDGAIARKHNLVTDFGKFLDPLADKILVMSALVAAIGFQLAHPVSVILILSREFIISGLRQIAATSDGKVIAANWWGKIKTVLQMVVIIFSFTFYGYAMEWNPALLPTVLKSAQIGMWITAAYTAWSAISYLNQNKEVISITK